MVRTTKIYELTTNGEDGYRKYYVKGIKDDTQAKAVAKRAFGKSYWERGISFYDRHPSPYGADWKWTPSPKKFIAQMKKHYR